MLGGDLMFKFSKKYKARPLSRLMGSNLEEDLP